MIERMDGKPTDKDEGVNRLENFFDEVFPGMSFKDLRRKIRRDLEQTGNGYIEVLRNVENALVFLRHVASRTMRVMRLDAPIIINKKLMRNGVEVQIPTLVRERRFAQMIGAT